MEKEKVYVRWYIQNQNKEYVPLDWSHEALQGYDEENVDETTITSLINTVNPSLEYFGYFKTEAQLSSAVKAYLSEKDSDSDPDVDFTGPGHYLRDDMDYTFVEALSLLEIEYDHDLIEGHGLSRMTGWARNGLATTLDLQDCLTDLLEVEDEEWISALILNRVNREIEEGGISRSRNNFRVSHSEVDEILEAAGEHGRVRPANMT